MGKIIFYALIRIAVLIPLLWVAVDYIDYKFWWAVTALAVYIIIIHPAIVQHRTFREENEEILTDTICSQCRHFNSSAVLCTRYDEHPTEEYIPCGGVDWEPI